MKKHKSLLIRNGTIITLGKRNRVLENHSVLVEGDRITRIAPTAGFRGKYGTVLDARGKVVMPGLINAHMHFYSTLVRGLGKAKSSANFNEILENLWWRLDRKLTQEDCYISAAVSLIEAVKKGTTTLIDHHASPGAVRGSLDAIAQAVKDVGLRASLCYEVSDRDGEKVAREGLEENAVFIDRCRKEKDPQLSALFGLHASFTVSDKTLRLAVEMAGARNTGFHVHTAEATSDQEHSRKAFGKSVVERFHHFGVLGPQTICAHCVHVDDRDIALLAESGTQVVHNPQSNMNNAVGIANVLAMMKKGIPVGLGTDAMTVNMFEEMRSALWAQKLRHNDPSAGFAEMLSTLAFNNAGIADRLFTPGLGQLKEGGPADIILIDYFPPTPLNSDTFLGHLCFGLAQSTVDTTIASGKILMLNKELKIGLDEAKVAAKASKLARKLWARF